MTINEAIKHAEEMAEKNEKQASWFWGKEGNPKYESCVERAKEHRQLAEWLKELEQLREQTRRSNQLIKALEQIEEEIDSPNRGTCDYFIVDRIEEIINKYKQESKGYMKIEFIKDFAKNWKAGEIVEAKYVGMGEILVDNVATVDAEQLLKHCKIVSESEE